MDEIMKGDQVIELIQAAGLNPRDLNTDEFMDAFEGELHIALGEASKAAADKREAELAAQLDPQFQAKLAQDTGQYQRMETIFARRQQLNVARDEKANLSDEDIKAATKNAVERAAAVMKQKQLRAAYEAELYPIVSGPYYPNRIALLTEIKTKYRRRGLSDI